MKPKFSVTVHGLRSGNQIHFDYDWPLPFLPNEGTYVKFHGPTMRIYGTVNRVEMSIDGQVAPFVAHVMITVRD